MSETQQPDIKYVIRVTDDRRCRGFFLMLNYDFEGQPERVSGHTTCCISACRKFDTEQEAQTIVTLLQQRYQEIAAKTIFSIEPRDVGPKPYLVDMTISVVDPQDTALLARGMQATVMLRDNIRSQDNLQQACRPMWEKRTVTRPNETYDWSTAAFRIIYPPGTPWYEK